MIRWSTNMYFYTWRGNSRCTVKVCQHWSNGFPQICVWWVNFVRGLHVVTHCSPNVPLSKNCVCHDWCLIKSILDLYQTWHWNYPLNEARHSISFFNTRIKIFAMPSHCQLTVLPWETNVKRGIFFSVIRRVFFRQSLMKKSKKKEAGKVMKSWHNIMV